ncbi:MAG: hypothetical protein HOD85_07375 [Deltaproteobacteria bacterium]|nr:hypothetical protein [Deltaproteobacteria bacterium]
MGYKHFTISDNQRKEYASGFLLDLIIKRGYQYSVVLMDADKDLEQLFVYMMSKDYLTLDKKNNYVHTQKGLEKLENLKKRYEEYLAHFDLFCAVDLESGEFAFEKIFELDDEEWELYVNDERFVDLRIATAWFKKINPSDFVFLSFLKEKQFDINSSNWQFDILSGLIWEKIEEIIDTSIQIEELEYMDEDNEIITGMRVMEDVVRQGAKLSEKLYHEEEHLKQESSEYPNDYYDSDHGDYVVTTYESYYDPFYINPIWFIF